MESRIIFGAPWGISVKLATIFSVCILVGIPVIGSLIIPENKFIWLSGMVIVPLVIMLVAAFFIIRGYELTKDRLLIERPGSRSG